MFSKKKIITTIAVSIFATAMTHAQLRIATSGKVGITMPLTSTPQAALDLGTAQYYAGAPLFLMYNNDPTSTLGGIKMGFYADNFGVGLNLNLVFPEDGGVNKGLFSICAKPTSGTTLHQYFSIAGMTGNVGIGTSSPLTKLHINGDTYMPLGNSLWFNATMDEGTRLRLFTANENAYLDYSKNLYFRYGDDGSLYGVIFHSNGYESINCFHLKDFTTPTYPLEVNGYIKATNVVVPSDIRYKDNIVTNKDNTTRLMKLTSVNYDFKKSIPLSSITSNRQKTKKSKTDTIKGLIDTTTTQITELKFDSLATSRKHFGFIAQDLQKVFPELVYADKQGYLSVDYISLIPILVGSFQEQAQLINAQSSELANQANDISNLKQALSDAQSTISNCCATSSKSKLKSDVVSSSGTTDISIVTPENSVLTLYQNAPNPFKENTTIKMLIPQAINKALLTIYDLTGKQLKSFSITDRGTVSLTINGTDLSAGMYHYALIADGSLVDTKTMILTE